MKIPTIEIPDKKGLREFGLIMGALFAGVFGILLPWLFSFAFPLWPWLLAGVLWFLALLAPWGLKYVYWGWMHIANVLGWVNTRLILAIAFYLVITPMGLMMQIIGKNPLKKQQETAESYRHTSPSRPPQHMEHPF